MTRPKQVVSNEKEGLLMRLEGKVALITGSSKGIGEAIALAYASQGAHIILNGRNHDDLRRVEKRVLKTGADVLTVPADVSAEDEVQRMMKEAVERFGRIDILVNNAGQMFFGGIEETTSEDLDRALNVNLKSVFLCSQAVLPRMKALSRGRIINISSGGGKNVRTIAGFSYGITKAAIIYLTRRMAHELGKYGITANCIAPGAVDTAMSRSFPAYVLNEFVKDIPLGRLGQPEDVAKVALFLASEDADYVTGEVIDVNGGAYID